MQTNRTIQMKTLRYLIKELDLSFPQDFRCHSAKLKMNGSIFGPGGYGIKTNELESYLDKIFTITNIDIGDFSLTLAEDTAQSLRNDGVTVETLTEYKG